MHTKFGPTVYPFPNNPFHFFLKFNVKNFNSETIAAGYNSRNHSYLQGSLKKQCEIKRNAFKRACSQNDVSTTFANCFATPKPANL